MSARPRAAVRGPRPADFLKGEITRGTDAKGRFLGLAVGGAATLGLGCHLAIFFLKIIILINLFLVALGLRCRLSLVAVSGATLLSEHGLWVHGLQ